MQSVDGTKELQSPHPEMDQHFNFAPTKRSPNVLVKKHISYFSEYLDSSVDKSHPKHYLDLYMPARLPANVKVPVIINVHGGGWQRGDKSSRWRGSPVFSEWCAENNMIAVSISYRLAKATMGVIVFRSLLTALVLSILLAVIPGTVFHEQFGGWKFPLLLVAAWSVLFIFFILLFRVIRPVTVRHPEQVIDVARAVAWVRSNLCQYCPQADMEAVYISGHSAGAHLASLVTLDPTYFEAEGVPKTFIKGVIAISGVYTLNGPMDPRQCCGIKNVVFRFLYTTSAFGPDADVWVRASPVSHVSGSAPPFIILSASSDMGLEHDAKRLHAALKEAGTYAEYHVVPRTGHASIASRFHAHEGATRVFKFIERHSNARSFPQDSNEK